MIAGYSDLMRLLGIFMAAPDITPPTPGTIPPYKGFIVNLMRPMGGWSK